MYKLIDFFYVVMLAIIFVCVIEVIVNVDYSKYKAKRLRKQEVRKICRATIAEKWNKLTNEEKRQFQTMPEDPILDVAKRVV